MHQKDSGISKQSVGESERLAGDLKCRRPFGELTFDSHITRYVFSSKLSLQFRACVIPWANSQTSVRVTHAQASRKICRFSHASDGSQVGKMHGGVVVKSIVPR